MKESGDPPPLMASQQAAVAKLSCAVEEHATISILCGPRGVGKTTVLERLETELSNGDRKVVVLPIAEWAGHADAASLPDVVVADDAHDTASDSIHELMLRCRERRPAAGLVLAGEGRLHTLIARDVRLSRAICLRATLGPVGLDESRRLTDAVLPPGRTPPEVRAEALRTIHEIAGGIPEMVIRLARLARVVADARPHGVVTADDIEAVHRRLSADAA